jgi:hypothetical protein
MIYYAQLVHHLLSSNFLVTSHDDSTRSRLNDNKYLGIITTYTIKHSTLNHSKYTRNTRLNEITIIIINISIQSYRYFT